VQDGQPDSVLIAPGYFPEVASFPLHQAIYGSRLEPKRYLGSCTYFHAKPHRLRFTATVDYVALSRPIVLIPPKFRRVVGSKREPLVIDAQTVITDSRHKIPHTVPGDKMTVQASQCRNSQIRQTFADRITLSSGR
jgi:hypothetical protein